MTQPLVLGTLLALSIAVGAPSSALANDAAEFDDLEDLAPRSQPIDAGPRTERFAVTSESLDEVREVVVRLPADYSSGDASYPVFYVTDADWQFPVIAESIEYLSYWKRIPPMIVVGILNVERSRDFVPREDPNFPLTGGADRFGPFLVAELRAEIDARYRTSDFRVLFGHSFGGVLTVHTLFEHPDAFDAFLAVGTSTWIAERVLFEEAEAFFAAGRTSEAMVYLAVAEADGGATVPDGEAFAALWREKAPESLEWTYHVEPRTSHFTAVLPNLHRALDQLYPAWGFVPELTERLDADGPTAVEAVFDEWRAEFGPRFFPQIMELNEMAFGLLAQEQFPEARALLQRLRQEAPASPDVWATSGYVEMFAGDLPRALDYVKRSLAIGEQVNHFSSRMAMYEGLRAEIERQMAEGGR